MLRKAAMNWKDILSSLDKQCAEHGISNAFRDAVRVKLIEKALIPVIRRAPSSLRVIITPKGFGVRMLWKDIPNGKIGILVYRPVSKPCSTLFVVFRQEGEPTDSLVAFDNEQEAAKELHHVLQKT